jgi:glycosyltransferase involved in cell wall biosynthesis
VPALSVTIITLNEADHIGAAIDSASWADEVIVVDSGSTDETVSIARARGARVTSRIWTGYVDQKNFAAGLAKNDWILSLDADERVTPELANEIRALLAADPPRAGIACLVSRIISDAGFERPTSIRTSRPVCTIAGARAGAGSTSTNRSTSTAARDNFSARCSTTRTAT